MPGTLLGLFAGVICDPSVPIPPTPKRSIRPFLRRYDGFWIDYEKELPYPLPSPGTSFEDHFNDFCFQSEKRGEESSAKLTEVSAAMINPYAVGHSINHPPPDQAANVVLVDFDLPYTFFPSSHAKHIPYIKYRDAPASNGKGHASRPEADTCFRAVAIVAADTIHHGEELYVDYLKDERIDPAQLNYTPDWLLEAPPASPFLTKKQFVARVPWAVKVLHAH